MNVLLMHPNQAMVIQPGLLPHERDAVRDLGVDVIVEHMSHEDKFIRQIAERTVLSSVHDIGTILYRQAIVKDAVAHPAYVRNLYALVTETLEQRKRIGFYGIFRRHPAAVLRESIEVMQFLIERLRMLRNQAIETGLSLSSEGFSNFANRIESELSDEYLETLQSHLHILQFRRGLLMSARLDWTLKGVRLLYTNHQSNSTCGRGVCSKRSPSPTPFILRTAMRRDFERSKS
jgi:hypothetical protein